MLTFDYKKLLFAAGLAAGLFLIAGQAMAMAYAKGAKMATTTQDQYVTQSQQDQAAVYQRSQAYPITGTFATGGNNVGYFSSQSAYTQFPYNAAFLPVTLMYVITTVLVWVVLIELIFLLAKLIKKRNQ